jgi:capsular polysaccharide biosynthesis protein
MATEQRDPDPMVPESRGPADWMQPERREPPVTLLSSIRARPAVVILVALATVVASAVYLAVRSPDYEATTKLLVQPIPADDQTFLGLPLLRDTGDPVRTMQTAAGLVESPAAAALVVKDQGGDTTTKKVLDKVKVSPEGQSNILGVTGTAGSADSAARLADQFSRAVLQVRSREIAAAATRLRSNLQAIRLATPITNTASRADLATRIDQVNSLVGGTDPTLQLSQTAIPPSSAKGPSSALILALAVIAGLLLGSVIALLMELAAPSRRRRD